MAIRNERIGVAFLGAGTVGAPSIAESLRLGPRQGLDIRGILVRDLQKPRSFGLPVTTEYSQILNDPKTRIIVSLLGDEEVEYLYMRQALNAGKSVVTANKAVIAKYLPQLYSIAQKHNVGLFFEAAVAGGIQVVDNLLNRFPHNRFMSFAGIVNGTTNHMLTEMTKGLDYQTALKEAQAAGYAEPDPTNDVEGLDAQYKLAIIASLAFRRYVSPDKIHTEGITGLEEGDFYYAAYMGYVIKLIASARKVDEELELWVAPTLVRKNHPLANINGSLNGLFFEAEPIGVFALQGRGAGGLPTASAVISDIRTARDHILNGSTPKSLDLSRQAKFRQPNLVQNRYFVRTIMSEDPGTLAKVLTLFGDRQVSISGVVQEEDEKTDRIIAECVITTWPSEEGKVQDAVEEITRRRFAEVRSVLRILPKVS